MDIVIIIINQMVKGSQYFISRGPHFRPYYTNYYYEYILCKRHQNTRKYILRYNLVTTSISRNHVKYQMRLTGYDITDSLNTCLSIVENRSETTTYVHSEYSLPKLDKRIVTHIG